MSLEPLLNSPFGDYVSDSIFEEAAVAVFINDEIMPAVIVNGNHSDYDSTPSTMAGCWLDEVDMCRAIVIARWLTDKH